MEHKKRNARVKSEPFDASFIIEAPTPLIRRRQQFGSAGDPPPRIRPSVQTSKPPSSRTPRPVSFVRRLVHPHPGAFRSTWDGAWWLIEVPGTAGTACTWSGSRSLGIFTAAGYLSLSFLPLFEGFRPIYSKPNAVFGTRENMALIPLAPRLLHPFSNLKKVARHQTNDVIHG